MFHQMLTFNRTRMELKPVDEGNALVEYSSFNRTRMELKLTHDNSWGDGSEAF